MVLSYTPSEDVLYGDAVPGSKKEETQPPSAAATTKKPADDENVFVDIQSDESYVVKRPESSINVVRARIARWLERPVVHWLILFLTVLDLLLICLALAATTLDPTGPEIAVLTDISIAILSVFIAELVLEVFAHGPSFFTKSYFHVFDAVVILTAFVLELVVRSNEGRALGGLMIILRLWRIVRIVDTAAQAARLEGQDEVRNLKIENKKLKAKIERLEASRK